jgi:hypothetical protein
MAREMNPRLSPEQRQAITERQGQPIPLEPDDQTQQVYVLVEQQTFDRAMQALAEREDLESIRRGIEQMKDGKGRPLSEVDADIRQKLGFPPRS